MLTTKLTRIKQLIEEKERIDSELSELLGETDNPRKGRPRKKNPDATQTEIEPTAEIEVER